MGFGTLFIGYFLLLNFAYCSFSDAVAAVLITYAFHKLSRINDGFKYAFFASIAFTLLGIFELGVAAYDMFIPLDNGSIAIVIPALLRNLVIAFLSFLMLVGINDVATEVGLSEIALKAKRRGYLTIGIFALNILLESQNLIKFIDSMVLVSLYAFAILAMLAIIIMNLASIYSCYMRICMPDDVEMEQKPSKIGFVNEFKRHEEEKSREFAEYKLKKMQSKNQKQRKK